MPRTATLRCSTRRSSEAATCMKAYGDAKSDDLAMREKQAAHVKAILDMDVWSKRSDDEENAMVYENGPVS